MSLAPGDFTGSIAGVAFGDPTAFKVQGITGWFDYTAAPFGGAQVGGTAAPAPKPYANGSWPVPYWVPLREIILVLEIVELSARAGSDGTTAAGSTTFISTSGLFTSGDVGRGITLVGVGPGGADLATTVAAVDATTGAVTLAAAAAVTRSAVTWTLAGVAFSDSVDQLLAATVQDGTLKPITVQVNGVATTAYGSIINRSIPTDLAYIAGLAVATVSLECPDPRRFGAPVTMGPFALPSGSSFTVPGLVNAGNVPSPLTVTLTGQLTDPQVACPSTGGDIQLVSGHVVGSGAQLTLDMENRTATESGASVANKITVRNWFDVPPGAAAIVVSNSASSGGEVSLTYTPAWL